MQQLKIVGVHGYLQDTNDPVIGVYDEVSIKRVRVAQSKMDGRAAHFPLWSHAMCLIAALPPDTFVQLNMAFDLVLNVARTPEEVPTCIVLPSGENTAVVVLILIKARA